MKHEINTAENYLQQTQQVKQAEAELVEVQVPSGFVFVMQKPGKMGMLFGVGQLPIAAASRAVEAWQRDGVIDETNVETDDGLKLFDLAIRIRDRVLALSHSPKLVVGPADASKNELSTDNVLDIDLDYLFRWVQAGGDASKMLGNFPGGPGTSADARPNRKGRRAAAKRGSRN